MTQKQFLTILVLAAWPGTTAADEDLSRFEGRIITRIEVSGNQVTRDHVIRRELRSQVGKPLHPKVLQQDLQRLDNLDVFSSMEAVPAPDGEGVALNIKVRELPPMVPYISYDVTDEDGWSFGPALKAVNLLGLDLYVAGFALFGGKTIFLIDLSYPWIAGNDLALDLDLARIERENELDSFRETSFEFSPWIGTYIGERGRIKWGGSYFKVRSDAAGHTLSAAKVDHLVRLGVGLGYDSRDVWGDPHQGWLNELEVMKTGGFLPGDGDFWTAHIDLRRFQPLTATHTLVLAGLLTLQSGRLGRDLPEYMDFHLGGSNTIRGYDLNELGHRLRGSNQLLTTVEYRFPLIEKREYTLLGLAADLGLAGALFTDTGLAWSREEEFAFDRARTGYGLGLRLLMPAVDMSRFDIGFDGEGNWRLHLAVFSKMTGQRFRLR